MFAPTQSTKKFLFAVALVGLAFAPYCGAPGPGEQPPIVVGSKPFAEQRILSEILMVVLSDAGVKAVRGPESLNHIRDLQLKGQIDAYWEYTGTGFRQLHGLESTPSHRKRENAVDDLNELDRDQGLQWLRPAKFDNSFVLVVSENLASGRSLETISQLFDLARENAPRLCAEPEFFELEHSGLQDLGKKYGDFQWPREKWVPTPGQERYQAFEDGRCDVLIGYATDSLLTTLPNIRDLEDDEEFFPVYQPAPLFRRAVLERLGDRRAQVVERLECIADELTTEKMRSLNRQVEIEGQSADQAAQAFLRESRCPKVAQ